MNSPSFNERIGAALAPWTAPPREHNRPDSNGAAAPVSPRRMRRYAEAALEGERQTLARMAPKSGRNRKLFDAGCKLGKFVHHDVLSFSEVESAIVADACNANGLIREDGPRACQASLASGLRKAEGDELPLLEDLSSPGGGDPQANGHQSHVGSTGQGKDERQSQSQVLIEIATRDDVELFHSPDGTTYADINVDGHRETWPTKSSSFRRWLRRSFYEQTGGAPNSEAMSTATQLIEARAQFDGDARFVFVRVAADGDTIYVDLGDPQWRAIEIDADGWRIVTEPPVRFRRSPGMLALPAPVLGGNISELRKHLNLGDDAFVLCVAWLLSALRGRGPYPLLALAGEQGTGKSTAGEKLRRLVDPNAAPLRGIPKDVRDLAISANNSHVLVFDNLSGIPADIADALCRLSSGGGFSTRALYSDDEERIFDGQRPVIMTSISDVATRPDLADRTLVALFEAIAAKDRKTDEQVRGDFEKAAPHILGALLDAVANGLKQQTSVVQKKMNRLPRMADHAVWIRACEPINAIVNEQEGTHWTEGLHLEVYDRNRDEAVEIVLESDPVAVALRTYMDRNMAITITSTALLDVLAGMVTDVVRRSREWPGNARALSGRLRKLAPALRSIGIVMSFARTGREGTREINIKRQPPERRS
jgi:hypothetical protein